MMNVAKAIDALNGLLALPAVRPEARYYAKLAISHLVDGADSEVRIMCPLCARDMTPRPGAVLRCDREVCAFGRLDFSDPARV